ncbi:MAG: dimethyl sulfoxide reductase anchor subunit [Planctomycetota bacterium]|nr:dimethyl sulfoxide reductase anchor subunit [Planctomycetota bacterium]
MSLVEDILAATDTDPAVRFGRKPAPRNPRTVIDEYLDEQQKLTAVEKFSQRSPVSAATGPAQARYYAALLPAQPPGPGEQYAFEVDLDRCSGCKACVTACHSLNGLDDGETWRNVGLLMGGPDSDPVLQHVTTACHHCVEPACAAACPVDAYDKHAVTGIVRHLDDQCIGCQYCTLACPYDVPQYHAGKGIVRKCDMCSGRLESGEAPGCVQACPHEAIRISVVSHREVIDSSVSPLVPQAPDSRFTLPTTRYKSRRALPVETVAGHHNVVAPQHVHWSLVWMLVLTQISVGVACVVGVSALFNVAAGFRPSASDAANQSAGLAVALLTGVAGVVAATLHLGRPLLAFRAFLGLRHSWLSREFVAFGLYLPLLTLAIQLSLGTPSDACFVDWHPFVMLAAAGVGLVGVGCSAMIYAFTRRPFWNTWDTLLKFFTTTVLLGVSVSLAVAYSSAGIDFTASTTTEMRLNAAGMCVLVGLATLFKLGIELCLLKNRSDVDPPEQRLSAKLLLGPLRSVLMARLILAAAGGLMLPAVLWVLASGSAASGWQTTGLAVASALSLVIGELLERSLFFAAVVPLRMPGGLET